MLSAADLAVARTCAAALIVLLNNVAEAGRMVMPRRLFPRSTCVIGL